MSMLRFLFESLKDNRNIYEKLSFLFLNEILHYSVGIII